MQQIISGMLQTRAATAASSLQIRMIATCNCQQSRNRRRPPEFDGQYLRSATHDELHQSYARNSQLKQRILDEQNRIQHEAQPTHLPAEFQDYMPEALPHWLVPEFKNPFMHRLERIEMMKRRSRINIPLFYVGSIMAVTCLDSFATAAAAYAPTSQASSGTAKTAASSSSTASTASGAASSHRNRFVGICISREHAGLHSTFTLRNVIDNMGVEIVYELYNPTLLSIECLKLEKRLDANLYYLRDAPLRYSRVPFDMTAVPHQTGQPIPVNHTRVRLNERPWVADWWLHHYRGIDMEHAIASGQLTARELSKWPESQTKSPSGSFADRFDLMRIERERGDLAERRAALRDVYLMQQDLIGGRGGAPPPPSSSLSSVDDNYDSNAQVDVDK